MMTKLGEQRKTVVTIQGPNDSKLSSIFTFLSSHGGF